MNHGPEVRCREESLEGQIHSGVTSYREVIFEGSMMMMSILILINLL